MNKFPGVRVFTSGLDAGFLGASVALIMNKKLTKHVSKIFEIPGRLLIIHLLFKNKQSVSVLGLYAEISLDKCMIQAGLINSFIARACNESTFVILGGNFNKNKNKYSSSFSKCADFGLRNSRGVERTIDYIFVLQSLSNALINECVVDVDEFFSIDHSSVQITIGLGRILDPVLRAIHEWYRIASCDNFAMFSDKFTDSYSSSNLNSMWSVICKAICFSVNEVFSKTWFKDFDSGFTKSSSHYHRLELLVSKLVKASHSMSLIEFVSLLDVWIFLNSVNASIIKSLFLSGFYFDAIRSALAKVRKSYCSLNIMKLKRVRDSQIRLAINKRMENFELNKSQTIRSVLKQPFCKVILDYLVVDKDLILKPGLVKSYVNRIMESWTRKHIVADDILDEWHRQFQPLEYVFDNVFLNVMHPIVVKDFLDVVSGLLDNKAAGLSILKDTTIQSPIFAIGLVVKDALEKNCELWLVLQDMRKVQEAVCSYRLNLYYVVKSGHVDPQDSLTSFLAVSAFINDTIWVGSNQAATQHILNIASEFFRMNDISINNNKTVAIPINCRVMAPFLSPSLAKAHSDVQFFTNLVLKKAISDKQFSYLVLAVLYSIIDYRTQFSFISASMCQKWDVLIWKNLKLKSDLPLDFLNDVLHHSLFYGLKTFEQIQAKGKVAAVVCFTNSVGVLGQLFKHRLHDLQVVSWCSVHLLCSPVHISVNPLNNFLVGVVWIFLSSGLSLGNLKCNVFHFQYGTFLSGVLDKSMYFKCLSSLCHYGIAFVEQLQCHDRTRLDSRGSVPVWFGAAIRHLHNFGSLDVCSSLLDGAVVKNILEFHNVDVSGFFVYMDDSLCGLESINIKAGTAVFFKDIDLGFGIEVTGMMSSTLAELQAIALVLECMPNSSLVHLFSDSQAALDVYRAELLLLVLDFQYKCWVKR
ncbi:hypothetical protein G9A89_015856 [Geosiphon pyriformis]|nr:hypothetical protein G9A89_015856 [Geosiphon pyriformis]